MCIRDSYRGLPRIAAYCRVLPRAAACCRVLPRAAAYCRVLPRAAAVSYTHLTLPTICSV
eukprot:9386388-Alexandrium_andersonii.AAC.1